jgi:hypothetical protein
MGGFTYKLTPEAEKEYLDSYLYYEEKQDGLGGTVCKKH